MMARCHHDVKMSTPRMCTFTKTTETQRVDHKHAGRLASRKRSSEGASNLNPPTFRENPESAKADVAQISKGAPTKRNAKKRRTHACPGARSRNTQQKKYSLPKLFQEATLRERGLQKNRQRTPSQAQEMEVTKTDSNSSRGQANIKQGIKS